MKRRNQKRVWSLVVCLAMVLSYLPLSALAAEPTKTEGWIVDPSTMDSWREFFPTEGEISTENAGGVWMDRSVFAEATEFSSMGISVTRDDSLLVALSAIGSNMTVTGMASIPTDTMLVLDISGSMNDDSGNNDVAEDLVEAANTTIGALLSTNGNNRVGVVLYSGPLSENGSATANDAVLVLPLGRYTTGQDGAYLNYTITGDRSTTETVSLDADVRYEATGRTPEKTEKNVAGATYIQKGLILAMNQFLAEGNQVTVENADGESVQRKPVLVLMSDGAPTVGSTNFTAPSSINLGSGMSTSAALGFVSQLSAAYAKAKIEEKYGTSSLFYTLGLGVDNDAVALSVLYPDNSKASSGVKALWNDYLKANAGETVTVQTNKTVTKLDLALDANYVDAYFAAGGTSGDLAAELKQAFADIVGSIQLQSGYFPTLIAENEDLSGYVSFVDRLGEYMEVVDVKGVLINDILFSGACLASNFVPGGGELGTYDDPTALGHEMVAAVRERLGLESDAAARTLIGQAYEYGQIRYDEATGEFSNYIGWYANAAGEFLGFYHQGVTVLPEATGNADTDPVYTMRSYGYLGAVDRAHGVSASDMMYATVQVRETIATGEQMVIFAVPAALLPLISYHVTLDENGDLADLTVSGAKAPIRLVYEVALRQELDPYTISEMVSADYLAENTNPDGSVNFYAGQWDHGNTTGYGTVNSYSYFNPSRQNDRYYYQQDSLVYTDDRGTLYQGQALPSGTLYRAQKIYENGANLREKVVYIPISAQSLDTAKPNEDGTWYIPKGNVFVMLEGYTIPKRDNPTQTLSDANIPFVDTTYHAIDETGYYFYVGATFGNNGKLTVMPQIRTGNVTIAKEVTHNLGAEYSVAEDRSFTMQVTLSGIGTANATFPAYYSDGQNATVTTDGEGRFTVDLRHGQQITISGLPEGTLVTVTELDPPDGFTPSYWDNGALGDGSVTIEANSVATVLVINDYQPAAVRPAAISVKGEKLLENQQWRPGYSFRFRLEKKLSDGSWQVLAEEEVNEDKTAFSFDAAMAQECYSQPGVYAYRILEVEPENPLGGFRYDQTIHSFCVTVSDADMDGSLEIAQVTSDTPEQTQVSDTGSGWSVSVTFTNVYTVSGSAEVTIDLHKQLEDLSGTQSPAGFTFGLYQGGELVETSPATSDSGYAQMTLSYSRAGTYHYILQEICPEVIPDGWTYSDAQYAVTVVVSDNGDGTLGAVICLGEEQPAQAGSSIEATFVNRYAPEPEDPGMPQTDDDIGLWLALMLISGGAVVCTAMLYRKYANSDE